MTCPRVLHQTVSDGFPRSHVSNAKLGVYTYSRRTRWCLARRRTSATRSTATSPPKPPRTCVHTCVDRPTTSSLPAALALAVCLGGSGRSFAACTCERGSVFVAGLCVNVFWVSHTQRTLCIAQSSRVVPTPCLTMEVWCNTCMRCEMRTWFGRYRTWRVDLFARMALRSGARRTTGTPATSRAMRTTLTPATIPMRSTRTCEHTPVLTPLHTASLPAARLVLTACLVYLLDCVHERASGCGSCG